MTSPTDSYPSDTMALLDASVLRDVADALDGRWHPARESDPLRRERLLAAARLRLYGERDRSGWTLVSYQSAWGAALARGDTEWSVGFIPNVDSFNGAPADEEVSALARLYSSEQILPAASLALAYAVLYEPVRLLISDDIRPYRHSRASDLPSRLELLTAAEAVERLELQPGEVPAHDPPPASPLSRQDAWWVI